jgi:hypothetical protein
LLSIASLQWAKLNIYNQWILIDWQSSYFLGTF